MGTTNVLRPTARCINTRLFTGYENMIKALTNNYELLEITEFWIGQHWILDLTFKFYFGLFINTGWLTSIRFRTELEC